MGSSKHAAWRDEYLALDTRPLTRQGPGSGHAEPWRDREPVTDDDVGILIGNRWQEPTSDTGA